MAIETCPIPIKIQCDCGQRYAFEVQPLGGRMPGPVACPACRADGTAVANRILADQFPAPTPIVATPAPVAQRVVAAAAPVRAATPAVTNPASSGPAPAQRVRLPGQLDPEQAQREARSKIMWGDDPSTVSTFLMSHGFSMQDAQAVIAPLLIERKQSVRSAGSNKIFIGIGMMLVPVIAWVTFMSMGVMPIKLMGIAGAVGLWGMLRVITGIMMVVAPKGETGDLSEM